MANSFVNSFVNEIYLTPEDLNYADLCLEWVRVRGRGVAREDILWKRLEEDSPHVIVDLQTAKECAERYAQRLVRYHGGRLILHTEDPGEHASDSGFWLARAEYYRLEYEKLQEEDYNRASGSVTPPGVVNSEVFTTELDRAYCCAGNAARQLADYPAGKALLVAEYPCRKNSGYWWSIKNFQTRSPAADSKEEDFITDPAYWQEKEKFYNVQLKAESEKTKLERAKRSADSRAKDLATFPAGMALIAAEDHGSFATDPEYWWAKKAQYMAEIDKLRKEFWEQWKRTRLDGGKTPIQSFERATSWRDRLRPRLRGQTKVTSTTQTSWHGRLRPRPADVTVLRGRTKAPSRRQASAAQLRGVQKVRYGKGRKSQEKRNGR